MVFGTSPIMWIQFRNDHSGPHPVQMVFGGSSICESYLKMTTLHSGPHLVQMVFGASPLSGCNLRMIELDHILCRWFSVPPHYVNPIWNWPLWTTSCPDGFRWFPTTSMQCWPYDHTVSFFRWYHLTVVLVASRDHFGFIRGPFRHHPMYVSVSS